MPKARVVTDRVALKKALTQSKAAQGFANELGRQIMLTARSRTAYKTGALRASMSYRVRKEDSVIELGNGIAPGHDPVPYHAAYMFGHPHTSWNGNNTWQQAFDHWRGRIHQVTRQSWGSWRELVRR